MNSAHYEVNQKINLETELKDKFSGSDKTRKGMFLLGINPQSHGGMLSPT
jgi:hypothetical protein